jgi:hypothetical protein
MRSPCQTTVDSVCERKEKRREGNGKLKFKVAIKNDSDSGNLAEWWDGFGDCVTMEIGYRANFELVCCSACGSTTTVKEDNQFEFRITRSQSCMNWWEEDGRENSSQNFSFLVNFLWKTSKEL